MKIKVKTGIAYHFEVPSTLDSGTRVLAPETVEFPIGQDPGMPVARAQVSRKWNCIPSHIIYTGKERLSELYDISEEDIMRYGQKVELAD